MGIFSAVSKMIWLTQCNSNLKQSICFVFLQFNRFFFQAQPYKYVMFGVCVFCMFNSRIHWPNLNRADLVNQKPTTKCHSIDSIHVSKSIVNLCAWLHKYFMWESLSLVCFRTLNAVTVPYNWFFSRPSRTLFSPRNELYFALKYEQWRSFKFINEIGIFSLGVHFFCRVRAKWLKQSNESSYFFECSNCQRFSTYCHIICNYRSILPSISSVFLHTIFPPMLHYCCYEAVHGWETVSAQGGNGFHNWLRTNQSHKLPNGTMLWIIQLNES